MKTTSHEKNILKVINVRWDTSEAKISKLEGIAKTLNHEWTREKKIEWKKGTEHQWNVEQLQAAKYVAIWSSIELRLGWKKNI